MKRFLSVARALVGVGVVVVAACSKDSNGPAGPPAGVTATVDVSPGTTTLPSLGATQQLTATVRDGLGSTLSGKSVSWSSSAPGVASVTSSGLVTAVANGAASITASVDGKSGTAAITVSQQATQLVFVGTIPTVVAGSPLAPRVEVRDASGAVVSSFGGAVSIALSSNPGNATLGGTLTVNAANGVANFPGITITRSAQGYRLLATATGVASVTSGAFDIAVGPLAKLVFTSQPPATIEANTAMAPRIVVEQRDAYDNVVTGGTVALSLAGAPWPRTRLLGTTTGAATTGVASFNDLRVDRPGAGMLLVATAGGVTAQSSAFAVQVTFTTVSGGGTNSSGTGFTCGIAVAATFCWGVNYDKQLGDRAASLESVPFLIEAPAPFVQLAMGTRHACGLTADGTVYCWGHGASGELGDGQQQESAVPVRVTASGPTGGRIFTQVTAGDDYTCGVAATAVYCWGANASGQLGTGSNVAVAAPFRITGTGVAPLDFTQVSASRNHTCGATTSGALWCWGAPYSGKLGDGQQSTFRYSPVLVTGSGTPPLRFAAVAVGGDRTCAVTTGLAPNRVYCWGDNSSGRLGVGGSATTVLVPTVIAAPATVDFRAVSRATNVGCALDTTNQAWCWGRGVSGEIGDGALVDRTVPTQVTLPGGGFARLSVGGTHVCAIRTGAAGAYCWGAGGDGALGTGSFNNSAVPARVVQ